MNFPENPRPSPLTRLLFLAVLATLVLVAVHAFQIRELRELRERVRQHEVEPMNNAIRVEPVPSPFHMIPHDTRAGRVR